MENPGSEIDAKWTILRHIKNKDFCNIHFRMEFIASFSINSFYPNLAFLVAKTLSYNVYLMEQKNKIKLSARPIIISSTGKS